MKIALATIISGGQSGAERGALDAAIELGIPHGGACARGRKSDDGLLAPRYVLEEVEIRDFADRTEPNILNSDATLICTFGRLATPGKMAVELARRHGKLCFHLDLNLEATDYAVKAVRTWVEDNDIKTLCVTGNRESEATGLHGAVKDLLLRVFR
jgi:hypothetical protein